MTEKGLRRSKNCQHRALSHTAAAFERITQLVSATAGFARGICFLLAFLQSRFLALVGLRIKTAFHSFKKPGPDIVTYTFAARKRRDIFLMHVGSVIHGSGRFCVVVFWSQLRV